VKKETKSLPETLQPDHIAGFFGGNPVLQLFSEPLIDNTAKLCHTIPVYSIDLVGL